MRDVQALEPCPSTTRLSKALVLGALRASLLSQDSKGYTKGRKALEAYLGMMIEVKKPTVSSPVITRGENKTFSQKCRGWPDLSHEYQHLT